MNSSIWTGVNIHDAFCLDCDSLMIFEGYEKGNEFGKIIQSEMKDNLQMIYINFKCPDCQKRTSIMIQ